MIQRRHFSALAAAAALAPAAFAQERTMKIWIGFPPGGSADTIARVLAEKMKVSLGQNVVVDNKPGAAGRLILGELKRMPPDGQNLVLSPSGAMVIAPWALLKISGKPWIIILPQRKILKHCLIAIRNGTFCRSKVQRQQTQGQDV